MRKRSIPAIMAPSPIRVNPLTRSVTGLVGIGFLGFILLACICSLPWTTAGVAQSVPRGSGLSPRYDLQLRTARHLPPSWAWWDWREAGPDSPSQRLEDTARSLAIEAIARQRGVDTVEIERERVPPTPEQLAASRPFFVMGTDLLGRDLFVRCLTGGGISLTVGIAAAILSVFLGVGVGALAGYLGGRLDAFLMRVVDILYGLPSILLVVLLAVAVDAVVENWQLRRATESRDARTAFVAASLERLPPERRGEAATIAGLQDTAMATIGSGELAPGTRRAVSLVTLLVAIGGVSWLTMARVVRGQVLSIKALPFMEAARAIGVPWPRIFLRHLLPNLVGPIVVYATLTVPQAVLQESFLSFLGIGVKAPLPSWGNLASEGLVELNPYKSHWWLLLFPCLLLGSTLLALNFVGEALREAFDPKRRIR